MDGVVSGSADYVSLSVRRAWIEIIKKGRARRPGQSLSVRRAWIEIDAKADSVSQWTASLSVRRAWIEMVFLWWGVRKAVGRSP